jgi:hypothetical protein
MRSATAKVRLAWARDRAGRKVSVAALDPRLRGERAPFTCPGCDQELVPHLGRIRARHFAHRPGSTCPLAAPETALHWNAKERILELCLEAFAGRRRVTLAVRCPSCRRPAPRDLAGLGDAALVEGPVGPRRADVLVLCRGAPALALEVRVAHALGPEKEEALTGLGVPAAEIDARGDWEREDGGSTLIACSRAVGFSPCPACQSTALADAGRSLGGEEAQRAELEAYRARGLLGPPPGLPLPDAPALSAGERQSVAAAFRCRLCGGHALEVGERLVRHACPGEAPRALAWRGYDGALVELSWWRH